MPPDTLDAMHLRTHDEFQAWLASEVEVRDELETLLDEELSLEPDSLDTLEGFLLARYDDPDDPLRAEERPVLDAAARHIGLVMLLNIDGAAWDIDLDDPDDIYYRLPVIALPDGARECPLSLATACLDRRRGHYLRDVVETYVRDFNADDELDD